MVLSTSVSYEAMNGKTYSNLPACSWVPSFATDKVTSVAPRHRVLGALAHGVNCGAATVRPPRVEVAVIGSDGVGGVLTSLQSGSGVAIVALGEEVERRTENTGDSRYGKEERSEGDHGGVEDEISCLR
jgi:hypothetical protein